MNRSLRSSGNFRISSRRNVLSLEDIAMCVGIAITMKASFGQTISYVFKPMLHAHVMSTDSNGEVRTTNIS